MSKKYFSKLNGYFCKDEDARKDLNDNYYTKSEINSTLNDYVTSSSLSSTLNSYVTSSSLSSTLNSYVTSSSLSTTLGDYVTSSSLSTTLNDYKLKSDVTSLTGTIDLTDGVGTKSINYPSGFTSSNCVPIAMSLKVANVYSFGYPASSFVLNCKMNDNNITFTVNPLVSVTGSNSYDYKIILMKV